MREGWEVKTLGELSKIQLGKTPHRKNDKFWDKEKNSTNVWLSIADMKHGEYIADSKEYLSDLGAENGNLVPQDTLMISFKLTLGRVSFAGCDLLTNEAIASLVDLGDNISKKYLFYYFSFFDWFKATEGDQKVKGRTLNKKKLLLLPVIVPPLQEQTQIVKTLDIAFKQIDQAKANLEQNLHNAKELFESYLQQKFKNNISGDDSVVLNSICELIVDCEHKTAPKQEEGYPSIRTPNIGFGVLLLDNVNRVSEETYNKWTRRAVPQEDDLILAREAPAGNIGVIPKGVQVCLGQRTVLIRPKKDIILSKYLAFLILSKDVQKMLLSHSKGLTVGHINMKDIRAFNLYNIPSSCNQKIIIHDIDKLYSEVSNLKIHYQQKLNNLEELKKSILQKAFRGEL